MKLNPTKSILFVVMDILPRGRFGISRIQYRRALPRELKMKFTKGRMRRTNKDLIFAKEINKNLIDFNFPMVIFNQQKAVG